MKKPIKKAVPGMSQKSIYLPDKLWEKVKRSGDPNKQSYSNVIEIILAKELFNV